MVRAARMNMIFHGDGWSGINRGHGLTIHHNGIGYGSYTVILSNPPFAKFETDESILSDFGVGKNESGRIRGVNRALVFTEQIINLLAEGGRAGLVLPRSIFENESYAFRKLREIIFAKCEILATIGLPRTAFTHTDTGILGDLLFIQKKNNPRTDYDVFVAWAENVGYNTLGHNVEENDFPKILEGYHTPPRANLVPVSQLKATDNINPWHYHPEAKRLRQTVRAQKSNTVPLTSLVSPFNNRISRKALRQTPDRALRYLEVGDFDPETGAFVPNEHRINTLPSRATYELTGEELVLLPNAKNSLESGRRVIKIGAETKGLILTNRFLPLRAKVNADYIVMMLNTPFVRDQLLAQATGAGSPDVGEKKLARIMIPVPNSDDLSSIDSFMERVADKVVAKKEIENKLLEITNDIDSTLASLYHAKK